GSGASAPGSCYALPNMPGPESQVEIERPATIGDLSIYEDAALVDCRWAWTRHSTDVAESSTSARTVTSYRGKNVGFLQPEDCQARITVGRAAPTFTPAPEWSRFPPPPPRSKAGQNPSTRFGRPRSWRASRRPSSSEWTSSSVATRTSKKSISP